MSYIRIWIHLVFATKNREPFLTKDIRYKVQEHIVKNCNEKSIYLQSINGHLDHLHCLISLGKEQSISKISQMIKGGSSFWINQNQLATEKFMWQDDYYAVSVGQSNLERVINYIKNQEIHHTKKTFEQEELEFRKVYGFTILK